jgi:hypothetical protein
MFQEDFESYLGVYDESGRGKASSKKLIGGTSWRLDSTSQNVGIYSPKFQKFRMVWNLIFLYLPQLNWQKLPQNGGKSRGFT